MENIKQMATELKLGYFNNQHEECINKAKQLKLDYQEFLEMIMLGEIENRRLNGINHRIKDAKFVYRKYLEDFKKTKFNKDIRNKFDELENLNFIENKENVILVSNPGMGKTHFSIGIGIKACMEQKKVLFVSVPNLMIELKEAMSQNQIHKYKKKFDKYDLVILDELGYISFDKEGSEILFNLISNRINTGSIIITTNLSFDRWDEIFKDPILTAAMVDRLAHKSHILNMSGDSYRIEETIEWLKAKS